MSQTLTILIIDLFQLVFNFLSCGDQKIDYFEVKKQNLIAIFKIELIMFRKDSVIGKIDSLKTCKNWYYSRSNHFDTKKILTVFLDWNDYDAGDVSNIWNTRKKVDVFLVLRFKGIFLFNI